MKKTITLLALLAFGMMAHAQKDSTTKSVEIIVDGNTLKIESDNLESLSKLDLTKMITEATKQVMLIQQETDALIAQIDAKEAAGEINAEEAQERREEVLENQEEKMEALGENMEEWGESLEESMEEWADQLEEQMEAWGEEVEEAAESGKPMPAIPAIPEIPKAPTVPNIPPAPNLEWEYSDTLESENDGSRLSFDGSSVILNREDKSDTIVTLDEDFNFDSDDFFSSKKKSKKVKRTDNYWDINFGWNQLLDEGGLVEPSEMDLDLWRSTSFDLGWGAKSRLGNPYSKAYLKYGIEFAWNGFRLNGTDVLTVNSDGSFLAPYDSVASFEKNKFASSYFNIPVMFQLDFSDVGERDESWTLGVGGYAGVRMNAKRKLEYSTEKLRKVEEEAKGQFYTSNFRYGLMFQIGYGSYKVTASYDFNPYFRDGKGPNGRDYNMVDLSIGYSW